MNAAVFSNPHNDHGLQAAIKTAQILLDMGCAVRVCAQGKWPAGVQHVEEKELCTGTDMMIVLGGDGTILRATQLAAPAGVPMLGINMGRKGFLAEVELDALPASLAKAVAGQFTIEKRQVLRAQAETAQGVYDGFALNDFYLLSRAPSHRMLTLEVLVNGACTGRYAADGMVVATPTGSTGYSLSAGGPVIAPELECMVITPICAHMLQARPMIVSAAAKVTLQLDDKRGKAALYRDGSEVFTLRPGDCVTVERSALSARFIRLEHRDFYGVLREKFSEWKL